MDSDEFRRQAHKMVDWMADYLDKVEQYPVRAQTRPGEIAAQLPISPPQQGEDMDRIFQDFQDVVLPGMTHWQHPRFMAYFPANSSPPSVLAEMLTATLAAQCMLWQTSPAATEMETRMLEWLGQMIGLPPGFAGVIQDSASSATLAALLVAREKATDWQINETGYGGSDRLAVYCSSEAHSSIDKGAKIAGYGAQMIRKIEVDENFSLKPEKLREAIEADLAAGIRPACIIACIGSTGVGASDDLKSVAALAREFDIYLHVDAAWAGAAMILPEQRHYLRGVEGVDSFVFNPHKWLLTNFDCTAHFVKDPGSLIRTLTILPAYLKSEETGQVIDYRDWSLPLGRRFRALKLWFVLRFYGVEQLQEILRNHIAWAEEALQWVRAAGDFEIMAPRNFALFNFRYHPDALDDEDALEALNERLVQEINDRGVTYVTQNRIGGVYCIRFNVGQTNTARAHVQQAWEEILNVARNLQG